MEQLALALLAFIGTHWLLSHPLRARLAGAMGEGLFAGFYSLVALATFGWIIWAFRAAPVIALWVAPLWVWHLGSVAMLIASILFAGSMVAPNPALTGQGRVLKTQAGPQGAMRITRHPMMWSFALWSCVHAAVAGHQAAVLLAAGIGFQALFGSLMQDRKKAKQLGAAWAAYAAETSWLPFARGRFWPGWAAVVAGLAVFLAATWLHPKLGAPVVGLWEYL